MAQFAIDEILTTGIAISGFVFDVSNNIGANGYVLTSTSSGVMWQADSNNADLSLLSGQIAATGTLLNNRIDSLSGYVNGTFLSGSGVANYVARWSNTKELLTGSIYDLGTGIGIGTTSPAAKLEVKGADDAVITAIFQSFAGNPAYNGGIQLGNAVANQNSQIYHSSAGDNTLTFVSNYSQGTANKFIFAPGGTETVRFQQNGTVGIGTNSPTTLLSVGGLGSATAASGITFGGDSEANLYRISTARLQTDGSLTIGGQGGLATALTLNRSSTSNENGIAFNSLGSTDWYFYVDGGNTHLQIQRSSEIDSAPRVRFDGANSNVLFNLGGGNVGIGAASPNTKLRISGSFSQRASGTTAIQEYKNIVTYNSDNYTTGAYVVRTPFRIDNSYEMPIVHVKGYGYGDAKLYDFKVVFYDYGESHAPISYSLIDLGNDGSPKYLAKDASNYINVCFGQTGDVHYYYRFTVDCITTRQENDYSQGWGMYQTKVANFGFASTGIYALSSPVNFNVGNNFVGIGKTNPSAKLDVVGNIYLSADIVGNDGTRGYLLGKDSLAGGRSYLILDPDAADGVGVGSDYLYIAQENTTGVISNTTAGPLLLNPGGGNVGVGTVNPSYNLDVIGTVRASGELISEGNNARISLFRLGGINYFDWASGQSLYFSTESSVGGAGRNTVMSITSGGNVGVGTVNAVAPIHIGGNASNNDPWMVLDVNDTFFKRIVFSEERPTYGTTAYGGYIGYDASANTVSLGTYENSVEKRSINILRDNGNIGIGVTNPSNKLHISGGGISFTTSTGLAVPMIGLTAVNVAYIGPYTTSTDGNAPTLVVFNQGSSVQQTYFYSSGRIAMVLNKEGRLNIAGNAGNTPPALLNVGPTSSVAAVSGMSFGNDSSANLYRSAASTIKTDGSLEIVTNLNVGADLYVADELGVGVPIASKRFNYGAEIGAASASIQLVLGRLSSATGQGGIGADASNTFAVWNVSGQTTKQFVITQQGNVGIGSETPTQKLDVSGTLKIKSAGTYSDPTDNAGFLNYDTVGGIFTLSARSDGGNTYMAFRTSNGGAGSEKVRIANNGNVGIGTPSPLAPLHVGLGGDWPSTTGTSAMVFIKQNASNAGLIIQEPGDASSDRVLHLYTNGSLATIEGTYRDTGPYPHLAFRTSGTERMRIASNGLVGISSTVPTDFLDFGGAGKNIVFGYAAYGEVLNSAASIIGNNVKASPTANSQVRRFANATDQGNFIKLIYNKGVTFHTNIISALNTDISEDTNERMRINLSGDVGIGAINPIYRLQLQANNPTNGVLAQFYNFNAGAAGANGAFTIWTQYGIADWFIGQPSGVNALTFGRDKTSSATGVEYMRINSAGNVGVGTISPAASLHIKPNTISANTFIIERYASTAKLIYAYESGADGYLEVRNGSDQAVSRIAGYSTTPTYFQSSVGIGTVTPSHKLHVYARGNGAGILIESDPTDDANQAPALKLYPKSPNVNERNWAISPFRDTPQSLSISSSDAKGGDPYSNGTTRLIIDGINGNVGVGTISPIERLHVSGNIHVQAESNSIGGNGIYLGGATTRFLAVRQTSTNKNFAFDTYNDTESWVNRLTILNNGGNVGIGQASPLEKLQVQGNIYATDGALFNFKAQRIPIQGNPQGGTYKGYLILAKAYTSGFLEASYVIGKVILRRGTSGTGHNVDIYEVNSSRGYNTEIFQVSRLGAIGTRFVRLVKVTYGGVVYHAIETSDSGGQPSTEMYFEGSIIDSPLILTDASFVSNVTAFGNGVIFVDQSSNIGIGTTSPDAALHVRGEQVYLYNDLNTNNTYFYARNSSAGNAGIKMKNSDGEWTIIANDRLRFIDDDAGVERLSILSNGNVGIGIVAPTDKIQISGGGISFTTSTGLGVPMLGLTALNIAYVGPYATPTDGNAPSTVLFNHGASVQQTWFYSSGSVAMVLNRQGRLHIGSLNNAPNCLLSVGPSSSTTAVSGMCFGNDAEANLYRSAEDTIKTDGNLIVVGNVTAANLVSGNGTANYITKWNGTKSIANSQIFDDGTYVGVNTAVNTTYRLQVNGSFAATTKSFDIVHPTISGKRLIYASLEGPENGVYFRGKNDNNEINLPHYWSGLVHDDSITVDLTSVGKRKDGKIRNYSVDQIGHNKVYIYTDSDDNIYDYYYTIFAERKDVSRLITERDME